MRRRDFIALAGAAPAVTRSTRSRRPTCDGRAHSVRRERSGSAGQRDGIPSVAAEAGLDRRPQPAHRRSLGQRRREAYGRKRSSWWASSRTSFSSSTALALQPLQRETRSVPIVFTQITDPVGSGFVASLANPGGNITVFTPAEFSMFGKSLEVLKEAAPQVTRVAVILNPEQKPQAGMWRAIEAAAPSFGVRFRRGRRAQTPARSSAPSNSFAREPNGGLIVLPNPVNEGNRS